MNTYTASGQLSIDHGLVDVLWIASGDFQAGQSDIFSIHIEVFVIDAGVHQHGIAIGRGGYSRLNGGEVTAAILFDGEGGGT